MKNAETAISYLSGLATEDALRYQMFLAGLERVLAGTVIDTDMSERTVTEFRQALAEYMLQAQAVERLAIEAQGKRLLEYVDLSVDRITAPAVKAARKQLKDTVITQMRRDILAAETHFQRIRTTAYLIQRSRAMGESYAMRMAYLQNKGLLKHVFVDRAGRRWDLGSFVRTTFRQYYLHMVNDLEVMALANQGVARAELVYANGKKIAFQIGANLGLPEYTEVKRLYLHPNSSALVRGTLIAD